MEVVVTGIGLISALGRLKPSWQRLVNGESGIQQHQPFPDLPAKPLALISQAATSLDSLTQQVVADALQDAGLTNSLPDCGVVIGSSRGCQASWEQLAQQRYLTKGSVNDGIEHWLDTLPHRAAIATARQVGSEGPVLAPMAACATGIWAIAQGFELIQTGQCQRVIAGAVEAPITPLTLAGFDKMAALADSGSYPFDRHREGLVLGEGTAVLVLESIDLARQRTAFVYGQVLGFGLTCDAYHVSAPAPECYSALAAVKQCLERSHLSPSNINYIHAHGTATQLNDQNEAQLIQYLFPQGVPVSSTKGATGHTLGASGALGAAFCLMALQHQLLPPCVGLREPEFDLDFVTAPRRGEVRQVLCFSFGFGGQNAVMALGK
ncbi:MAG TPA: beta-ketoacyl-ACP synthase [Cyanobacteria bacterium UBA8553]|nr:beta-ketoacyl-ACP synthase [Cyanobacteria bacterium UBA8553]HAJ62932.1 beta-ketoacyl-ACP synthase [Cyanobacteria bacterium UBA8543]